MKLSGLYVSLLIILGCICSCGEDRTYEYEEKTASSHFIYSAMQEWYILNDSLKEPDWSDYFLQPDEFISELFSVSGIDDDWSHCEFDTADVDYNERGHFSHLDTYGIDCELMTDPTGSTTRSYARVTYVADGSPAEECGLKRNTFIGYVDGSRISSSNIDLLENGNGVTLVAYTVGYSADSLSYEWVNTDTLIMGASTYVEEKAFTVDTVFSVNSHVMGYLMCNRMCCGPVEQGSTSDAYVDDLERIFSDFKSNGVDELILDLRLCNYGDRDMAVKLASKIISTDKLGTTFIRTYWNSDKTDYNEVVTYEQTVSNNLNLSRVFVITSEYTQGVAEWLIHSLRSTMGDVNVITVGVTTAGQNVELGNIVATGMNYVIKPVVAYVADAGGDYDYSSGISPDLEVDEFDTLELYPYGKTEETVVNVIIQAIIDSES